MNIAEELIAECDRRSIILEHGGGTKLNVTYWNEWDYTPELRERLRLHKLEILSVLEARRHKAAMHTTKQILMGEFGDAARERFLNALRPANIAA